MPFSKRRGKKTKSVLDREVAAGIPKKVEGWPTAKDKW